ncbi:hypothetical protein FRC04_006307 [Tulasnella sp. 424]|nr:hypothetical protein FRC04_006307 [Tulasnella sp. 424]KAG8980360.1 hypothetical protein FRC05_005991 [Tulasnella sp. 425]
MVQRNQTAEDSSPLIKWLPAGQWIDGTAADDQLPKYSAGSFRLTTTNGAYASFSFNGTGVWIYGAKRGNHGPYRCNVDGNDRAIQSGFSAANQISVELCSAPNLKMGSHVITITNLWTDATAPYLDVDYIVWETKISDQATRQSIVVDDNDTNSIQYTPPGEWSANACQNMAAYSANTCHVTGSNTAKASLTFEGDAIAVYGGVGPQYGPYTVSLDGQDPAQFTANSTNSHTQQILYFASGLGAGNHSIVINNNPTSIGNQLDLDYVQILGSGIPTTGTNSGNNSSGGSSKVGPIVGAVVGVIGLIALIGLGWFFWRRRKQSRQPRDKVDLGENDKSDSDVAMAHAIPTPYVVPGDGRNDSNSHLYPQGNNMSTHSVSMPQPQPQFYDNNNGARPYTGYGTQYTLSEGYPETPVGDTFGAAGGSSPGHRPQQPSTAYTANTFGGANLAVASGSSSNGDGSSRGGSSNNNGISPAGAAAPGSALGGEKGANLYTGPTVRNGEEQFVDAPPSYTT